MKIRTKLTFYFITITASLLLLSFLLIYYVSYNEREKYFNLRLKNKAERTAHLYFKVMNVDPVLLKMFQPDKQELLGFENISIYRHNKEIYRSNKSFNNDHVLTSKDRFFKKVFEENESWRKTGALTVVGLKYRNKGITYTILAAAKDKYGIDFLVHLRRNLFVIYVIILTLLTGMGWWYAKRALLPISKIVEEIDTISAKDLRRRLDEAPGKKDEIAILIQTFNRMLERVDNAFQLQRTFISYASHELMNPLTSITSQIEVILLSARSEEEYKKTLNSILEDIRQLNKMSEELIMLSKYNEAEGRSEFTKIRIDEVIWDARKEFLKKHPEARVNCVFENFPDNDELLYVDANETLLKTCFHNLIDNGVKFSSNKEMTIRLLFKKNGFTLHFENSGSQIDQSEYTNIFTPFYRGANKSKTKGYGIGLSIVKRLIELHNAQIQVVSEENKTIFVIDVPHAGLAK